MSGAICGALAGCVKVVTASISISDHNILDSAVGAAAATYQVNASGTIQSQVGILESWLLGGGVNSDYEVMATVTSGTLTSGTTDSWLSCATTRTWTKLNNAQNNSTVTVVLTVQIRDVATATVRDTATITLSAESDNFN